MRKRPITVTVDPNLLDYAEAKVASGEAKSVSSVVNDALAQQAARDRAATAAWRKAVERAKADPEAYELGRRRAARLMEILNGG
ncbi:hypothetical protein [Streptosporangium roseum]|uniref:hypothetical protein n=1 Tax=Streptosporangium roseum TaxID=2001 RepID=UPI003328AC16